MGRNFNKPKRGKSHSGGTLLEFAPEGDVEEQRGKILTKWRFYRHLERPITPEIMRKLEKTEEYTRSVSTICTNCEILKTMKRWPISRRVKESRSLTDCLKRRIG